MIIRCKLSRNVQKLLLNILHYAYMTACICLLMNDIALHCILIIHIVPVQYSSGHEVEDVTSGKYLLRKH